MNAEETIKLIKKWMKKNALDETTYSNICADDGNIKFKRTDKVARGDWSQKEWDKEIIPDFTPQYVGYEELNKFLNDLLKKMRVGEI